MDSPFFTASQPITVGVVTLSGCGCLHNDSSAFADLCEGSAAAAICPTSQIGPDEFTSGPPYSWIRVRSVGVAGLAPLFTLPVPPAIAPPNDGSITNWWVEAAAAGFAAVGGVSARGHIGFGPATFIGGLVRDRFGNPHPNETVQVNSNSQTLYTATTKADGTFKVEVTGYPRTDTTAAYSYELIPPWIQELQTGIVQVERLPPDKLDYLLEYPFGQYTISGRVVTSGGAGAPFARVSIGPANYLTNTILTDQTGAYKFTGVNKGTYRVRVVSSSGCDSESTTVTLPGSGSVPDLILPAGALTGQSGRLPAASSCGIISGKVVRQSDGRGLFGAFVSTSDGAGVTTDLKGNYSVTTSSANVTVHVQKEGWTFTPDSKTAKIGETSVNFSSVADFTMKSVVATQGIQSAGMSVPLLGDRKTFIRVLLSSPANEPAPSLYMFGQRESKGLQKPGFFQNIKPELALSTADARNDYQAYLFELPDDWYSQDGGRLKVTFEATDKNGRHVLYDCEDPRDLSLTDDCEIPFTFDHAARTIRIRFVPVPWYQGLTLQKQLPTYADINAISAEIKALLPLADVQTSVSYALEPSFLDPGWPYRLKPTSKEALQAIRKQIAIRKTKEACLEPTRGECQVIYLGVLKDPDGPGPLLVDSSHHGDAIVGAHDIGLEWLPERKDTSVFAHQLAWIYGRNHNACGGTDKAYPYEQGRISPRSGQVFLGFDRRTKETRDLLSYDLASNCQHTWISDYTYKKIEEDIVVRQTPRAQSNAVGTNSNGRISAAAPTVAVSVPTAGQTLTGTAAEIRWTAADPDGNSLLYEVLLSTDGGTTWQEIAQDWPATSFSLDTTAVPGSASAKVRVEASDGANVTVAESPLFTIGDKAPNVVILAPATGGYASGGDSVTFSGEGYDLEDGDLPSASLTWTSSKDGVLGAGRALQIQATLLSEGEHAITLTGKDSQAQTGSTKITLFVARDKETLPKRLAAGPSTMIFQATAGSGGLLSRILSIRNLGGGAMAWTAGSNQPWVKPGKASGSDLADLTISVDPTGLAGGSYEAQITIDAGSAGSRTIAVILDVVPPGSIYVPAASRP